MRNTATTVALLVITFVVGHCSGCNGPRPNTTTVQPPTVQWELVGVQEAGGLTHSLHRTPVPGGWLYRETCHEDWHGFISVGLTFVPASPEASP